MYLSELDIIAVSIALISQMFISVVLLRSARRWEQEYRSVVRLLKIERAARDYSVRNS